MTSRHAVANLLASTHAQARVVQCIACDDRSPVRSIADLTRAGWTYAARGLPVRIRWTCPGCSRAKRKEGRARA